MHTQHARQIRIYQENYQKMSAQVDRGFSYLLFIQWLIGIALVQWRWLTAWDLENLSSGYETWIMVIIGLIINVPSWALIRYFPGSEVTRFTIAVAQVLWSGVFVHFTGGQFHTYFHVFGSMVVLALYRDWVVLVLAAAVVASGHILANIFFPVSLYGVCSPQWARTFVDLAWLGFEEAVLVIGATMLQREMVMNSGNQASLEEVQHSIEDKVRQRTQELTDIQEQYVLIAEAANVIPFTFRHKDKRFLFVGLQATAISGYTNDEWLDLNFLTGKMDPENDIAIDKVVSASDGKKYEVELVLTAKNQRRVHLRCCAKTFKENGELFSRGIFLDITHHRDLESELANAQKLEAVGRLASGIAHEINTPIQFISDSVNFVREAVMDSTKLTLLYQTICKKLIAGEECVEIAREAQARSEELAVDELSVEVPSALDRAIDGIERIANIVRSMKEFAHPDQGSAARIDLNQAIASTLVIAKNEIKYVADLSTDFSGIPHVVCYVGEINQVILNLIINAVHAISEKVAGTNDRGRILVSTRQDGDHVLIRVSDTGNGIPANVQSRIFDPFFTTKEVGRGTGQGLAIARNVIKKHRGTISFETQEFQGTTFTVKLLINGPEVTQTKKDKL